MPIVKDAGDAPFEGVEWVGIAIRPTGADRTHLGFLYRSEANGVRLGHLAFHHELTFEAPTAVYKWLDVAGIGETNKYVIAAFFANLEQEAPDVAYGFGVDGELFDAEGRVVEPPIGQGLTCATFVTEAFRHQGFPLVQVDTWPDRGEQDAKWREWIISIMRKKGYPEQAEALEDRSGGVRVKPQEVAAAASLAALPATFDDVEALAAQIMAELAPV